MMEALIQDVTQALRTLRTSPVFAATAVLTLAVGIGANTAIFSVFNAVVLQPLSFPEPDTLVQLVAAVDGEPMDSGASYSTYTYWSEQTDVIEDVAAYRSLSMNYADADRREQVVASQVSAPYFRAFRAPIAVGRPLAVEDAAPGAARATVISYDFWLRRLGGDADILGKTLPLSGIAYTVVGVTAREFAPREFGEIDLWVPLDGNSNSASFKVAARLKAGISLEQAQIRLAASTPAFRERFSTSMRDEVHFSAVAFKDAVIATGSSTLFANDPRRALWLLSGAVVFVLLIVCANVSTLTFAHTTAHERDIAIRSALGAGRWRIVRQQLTESAIVSAIGGLLGLLLGFLGVRALLANDTVAPLWIDDASASLGMDWRVIAFAAAISIATAILSGVFPALAASRVNPETVIKHSSSLAGTGFKKNTSRSALVVVQISLAIVLLIGATLLIKTISAFNAIDPGFNVDDVVVMRTSMAEERFYSSAAIQESSRNTLERIRATPGVYAAAASCCVPLQRSWGQVFKVVGRDDGGRPFSGGGDITIATGDYFDALEVPLVRGRVFNERDDSRASPVIVINRTLAERWWPGEDPLGKRIQIADGDEPQREVIGIVENERKARLDLVRPIMYVPLAQTSDAWLRATLENDSLAWIVRTNIDPMQLASVIGEQIEQSTGVAVTDIAPMKDIVSSSISRQRANSLLMSVFGGIALLLAAIGVYGLVAHSVQQRTHEIGIRLALGARRGRVLALVLQQGIVLVVIGTAIGLTAAYFLAALLRSFLYGVDPRDVGVFVGAPVVLAIVTLVSVAIPAYKASRVDPLLALRCE
jgi:predicted permease